MKIQAWCSSAAQPHTIIYEIINQNKNIFMESQLLNKIYKIFESWKASWMESIFVTKDIRSDK